MKTVAILNLPESASTERRNSAIGSFPVERLVVKPKSIQSFRVLNSYAISLLQNMQIIDPFAPNGYPTQGPQGQGPQTSKVLILILPVIKLPNHHVTGTVFSNLFTD